MAAEAEVPGLRPLACALVGVVAALGPAGAFAQGSAIKLSPATDLWLERPVPAPVAPASTVPRRLRIASSFDSYLALPQADRPLIPGSTYADQYLLPDEPGRVAEAPAPSGLRSLAAEYRGERRSRDSATVHGLSATGMRETLGYGALRFSGTVIQSDISPESPVQEDTSGSAATALVSQDDLALAQDWRLAHALGDQPLRAPSLLAASARVQLPSSLMRGYAAHASDGWQHLTAQTGRNGRYDGVYVQSFEPQDARATTLDWQAPLTRAWDLALHAGDFGGHEAIRDHQSLGAAARWRASRAFEYRANALANDDGAWGAWTEAESQLGAWRHRYGLYHLEPELAWNDVQLANDRSGAHWRADLSAARHALGGGIDLEDTNVDADPGRAGLRRLSVFAGGSRQLRQRTRAGLGVNATTTSAGRGLATEDARSTGITASLNQGFGFGLSNFQLGLTRADGSPSQELHAVRALWDHEWLPLYGTRITTTLGSERLRAGTYTDQRMIAGVSLRRDLFDQLRLSADISTDRSDRTATQDMRTRSWTGQANAQWAFAPDWEAALLAAHTRVGTDSTAGDATLTEDRVLLTLRWAAATGAPYEILGRRTGAPGSGRIIGTVFRDANGDGVRNPGEEAEAGLLVYLDGRFARQTDPQGRFEFTPVHAGAHSISIAIEDVPLPYGPSDDTPHTATVSPRGEAVVDIPLVRILDVDLAPARRQP